VEVSVDDAADALASKQPRVQSTHQYETLGSDDADVSANDRCSRRCPPRASSGLHWSHSPPGRRSQRSRGSFWWVRNLKVGDSGTPSPAARPCRRHRPTGRCWVRPAGMSAG
jgi:hypothetical protein